METWLSNNWYLIFGAIGSIAYIAYTVRRRGESMSLLRRILRGFARDSDLGDDSDERVIRRLFLAMGGIVICLIAAGLVKFLGN